MTSFSDQIAIKPKPVKKTTHYDRLRWMIPIATCLSLASSGLVAQNSEDTSKCQPSDQQQNVQGIDVSHYQGVIRWDQVKQSGITFAFAKATGGTTGTDPQFANNWHSLRSEGLIRGAYHFFYPNEDATQQAKHFIDTVTGQGGLNPGDLPPMLDVEITDNMDNSQIIQGITTWLNVVEQALGCQPIIYTNLSFANEYLGNSLSNYPLWIAEYEVNTPTLPTGWQLWSFWQYSQYGIVPGVNGAVDRDKYNGSIANLKSFAKKLCSFGPKSEDNLAEDKS